MNPIYVYILAASLITSLISLIGVFFLSFSQRRLKKMLMFLVSLSAGALLGGAFLHLIPEALEFYGHHSNTVWIGVLGGILIFFVLEKFIHWHHCHEVSCDKHINPVGPMNLIGDGLHNLIDGMIIAGAFLVDVRLGIFTTIAVISHEIPQEIGDFGVLVYAGYKVKRALLFNFLSGAFSILGAIIVIIIGFYSESFVHFLVPFSAGGFIYIASSDLIPELKKDRKIKSFLVQILGILIGLSLLFAVSLFFHHH
jgi:zinc and cadmium transporter